MLLPPGSEILNTALRTPRIMKTRLRGHCEWIGKKKIVDSSRMIIILFQIDIVHGTVR